MQALQRFEGFIERLMEGSFARLFRSPIQPAELAKRLEREMEAQPTISVGRTFVPNYYEVALHPEDFAEFEPFKHSLEHNMAEFISDLAAERGYSLVSRPRVILQQDENAPKRSIEVTARLSDEPAKSALANTTRTDRPPEEEQPMARTYAMPQVAKRPVPGPMAGPGVAQPTASLRPVTGDTESGKAQPRDFPLTKALLSIGRGLENDLVIDDPRVSRHHAQITFRHGHYLLRDLRSTNGSFVNKQPVEAVVLAPGDMVSIGGFELIFAQE